METKIISINISPEALNIGQSENAGVMWEHNATTLVFNIDEAYVGDYRYYLEYRSLLGTKVRTEYLTLDTETNNVTYNVPVTMSSLKGVECYFNIVSIDGDGNTVQVIKPHKFCLEFDYSPDTDNSLAKVNDFSINALLEAIRLGTFKGDKGDKGDTGDKGEKGDKGDQGDVSTEYANTHFANAIKKTVSGNPIIIDDVSSVEHTLNIKTEANQTIYVRGKNLIPFINKKYNGKYEAGQTYEMGGISFTVNDDGSVKAVGTATEGVFFPLLYNVSYAAGVHTVTLSGSPEGSSGTTYCLRLKTGTATNCDEYGNGVTAENINLSGSNIYIVIFGGATVDATFYPMLEFGSTATEFTSPVTGQSSVADENGNITEMYSEYPFMSIFTNADSNIECTYNQDTSKVIEKAKEEVHQEVVSVREDIESLGYRLINSVTIEEDSQLVVFSSDTDGNNLKDLNLSKIFILFTGSFINTTSSQPLCVLFNGGSVYQMYKNFSITANAYYGFWFESERIASFSDKTVFRSIYPSALLGNFNADTEIAQGLGANNIATYSDLSVTSFDSLNKIGFGCFNSDNLMKSGSKVYLFGV